MSFKTILLNLNTIEKVEGLVCAAAHLAGKFQAHVIGLHVLPQTPKGGGTGAGSEPLVNGTQTFRTEAKRIQVTFEQAVQRQSFGAEWREVEARHTGMAETLMQQCRCVDLVVAGQSHQRWDFSTVLDEPERIAIESGRPVLIIPHRGRFESFGRRPTVAWSGRRESARAAFDAMPLLKTADNVRIVHATSAHSGGASEGVSLSDISAALSRHGVRCEAALSHVPNIDAGDALLSGLIDDGSDLLVMGAYGHTRFNELVLGGVTRQVLKQMSVPVFMSH